MWPCSSRLVKLASCLTVKAGATNRRACSPFLRSRLGAQSREPASRVGELFLPLDICIDLLSY